MRALVALIALLSLLANASARPARIILLRHAEKLDRFALCDIGVRRADALAAQYLGRGATLSLFGPDERPAAFFAITLHTLETISPAARAWGLPVTAFSVLPPPDKDDPAKELAIDERTREAARAALADPRYDGKIVVMTWEHKHLASAKLDKENADQAVTLRALLHLDAVAPATWPDSAYDFFWIVDYSGSDIPTSFRMVKQAFAAPFQDLPSNDWDSPEPLHQQAGCKK